MANGCRPAVVGPGDRFFQKRSVVSKLFIVSTPIGNLGDVTYRAVEVLRQVRRIMAEDTRRTAILCRRYDIDATLISTHAHNEQGRVSQMLRWLEAGEDIAIVTDAGTPLVSDPGGHLVLAAAGAGHEVVPVPGPSAVLAALVASGIASEPFTFYGFAPRTGRARTALLGAIGALPHTAVLFEAPGRIGRLLRDLGAHCEPERRVCVAREMTKLHESFFRGTLAEAQAYYDDTAVRGEIAVVVASAASRPSALIPAAEADDLVKRLLDEGHKPSSAAREAARRTGITRADAYERAVRLAAGRQGVEE